MFTNITFNIIQPTVFNNTINQLKIKHIVSLVKKFKLLTISCCRSLSVSMRLDSLLDMTFRNRSTS